MNSLLVVWGIQYNTTVLRAVIKFTARQRNNMPQSDAKKAARRALKKELKAAAGGGGKTLAVAQAVSDHAKKKGKKGGFWNVAGKAANMALQLAPMILPALLAKHGPTMQANASAAPAVGAAGVPIASSASCATCTGLYSSKERKGADGRVIGMRMCGLDYVGDLNVNEEEMGTVLSSIDLNPLSSDWAGTQLQRFATLFERYRPAKLLAMVEPSCPATTAGQLLGFIDPDPADDFTVTGRSAIQIAASHEGADISQVWAMNAAQYAFDSRTEDFYADADGSDARLVSPGTWRVLANTEMPADTPVGSLYVAWEYEFSIPQIEEFSDGGAFTLHYIAGGDSQAMFDDQTSAPWRSFADSQVSGNLQGSIALGDSNGQKIYAMPPGQYVCWWVGSGSMDTLSAGVGAPPAPVATVDGIYFQNAVDPDEDTLTMEWSDGVGGATGTWALFFFFRVLRTAISSDQGYLNLEGTGMQDVEANWMIMSIADISVAAASLTKKMTLQDFEKKVMKLEAQVSQLMAPVGETVTRNPPPPLCLDLSTTHLKRRPKPAARASAAAAAK